MAFRAVRTAVAVSLCLALVVGCKPAPDGDATIPHDTVRLTAQELAKLPRYGVQRLDCGEVQAHLESIGQMAPTDTVEISRDADSLVITPRTVVAPRGDTLTWVSDSLVWTARFMEMSPLESGLRTLHGRGTSLAARQGQVPRGEVTSVVAGGEDACGRYYFLVAAYDPARPDTVYLADPDDWVY